MMMLKMMNPMGSMLVRHANDLNFEIKQDFLPFQSVPGTGDTKEEDKGMTMEEKKEAERQR